MAATATSVASSNPDTEQQGPKFLYRIYLATPFQTLPPEIRLTQIAVWGSRMYDRTKIEMRFYSWMLIIIAVFDFGAWSLLFSQILTSGTPMLFLTPISLVLGFGMAFLFFKYERQVVVYDISRGHKRLFSAFGYRSIIVVLGALLTSQPIELLLFREPIQKRILQETIRAYLSGKLGPDLIKAEEIAGNSANGSERQRQIRQKAELLLDRVVDGASTKDVNLAKQKQLQAKLASDLNETKSARAAVDRARNACKTQQTDCEEINGLDSRLTAASDTEIETKRRLSNVIQALKDGGTSLDNLKALQQAAQSEQDKSYDGSEKLVERLKKWADKVIHTPDDQQGAITEITNKDDPAYPGFTVPERNYDFIQKLRILNDLKSGYPPRWPDASKEDITKISENFHMTDEGVEAINKHPVVQSPSQKSELALYQASYRIIFGLSVIIPLMSFVFKLLMPPELANYYSVRFQEKMGNPQARSYLEQRRELEGEDALSLPINSGMQVGGAQQA